LLSSLAFCFLALSSFFPWRRRRRECGTNSFLRGSRRGTDKRFVPNSASSSAWSASELDGAFPVAPAPLALHLFDGVVETSEAIRASRAGGAPRTVLHLVRFLQEHVRLGVAVDFLTCLCYEVEEVVLRVPMEVGGAVAAAATVDQGGGVDENVELLVAESAHIETL
jgi:hypothetical protein